MGRWLVVALAVIPACIQSSLSRCGDGSVCAAGLVCDDTVGGCIDPHVCAGQPDGTACGTSGACQAGTCAAAACGNGRIERSEQCDDGNALSHDGCSSTCLREHAVWSKLSPGRSPPVRARHAMAYDLARRKIVLFGGNSLANGTVGDTWEWDGTTWTQISPPSPTPAPR